MRAYKCEFTEYLDTLVNDKSNKYFGEHYLVKAEDNEDGCIMLIKYLCATRGYVYINQEGIIEQVCVYMGTYIYKGRFADAVVDLNKRFRGKKLNAVEEQY
ncbi:MULTISPECIES: hypothetical protein [Erysipelotrichaceae]|uniref:hypothetical protein n=1 Tax=Erysipelotrichaceae TaxID=128827 RepID=UPI000E53E046|nr:hypothetical protein [Absiella sp. AM27-20]RHU03290.1 hypothetical protein DW716_15830 [Absiella sp. AM27-20]